MSPNGELKQGSEQRSLAEIVAGYPPFYASRPVERVSITGLTADSREVKPGDAFVAITGTAGNGESYAAAAVAAGATVVICREGALQQLPETVTRLEVGDPRIAAAKYAAAYYAPQPAHAVAVTGTDGKSSTVEFIRQFWEHAGIPGAALGTIGLKATIPLRMPYEAINTTPDPILLHRLLGMLKGEGIDHVALEASSHGLDQKRLEGLIPEVGIFTTFGQDHLDYHHNSEEYFRAKMKLFSERMREGGTAILNYHLSRFAEVETLAKSRGLNIITFGQDEACGARLIGPQPTAHGQAIGINLLGSDWSGVVPLYGRFQLMNVLAASAACHALGMKAETIFEALPKLVGVRGRMEHVAQKNGGQIFVDYAHTAQGLEHALGALRDHVAGGGKLSVVFGCGGNRDHGKRAAMGEVAGRLADRVIVTDDNPRNENPGGIRAAILSACPQASEIADRGDAIHQAIAELGQGDVLLIAGKGHETVQIIGDQKFPFDDASVAREIAA